MIEIDGSQGEGGGQMIRSALALSMITGQEFTVFNVRAKRERSGLLRQHLTAVNAAAAVCDAEVEGHALKSTAFRFKPNSIRSGDYEFEIGTAGSSTLVFQTVLPALLCAEDNSQVTVKGGTHNKAAPPFDFLQHAYLPLLEKMGAKVTGKINAYGFYPVGGGEITFDIQPVKTWAPLKITEEVNRWKPHVTSLVSNLPAHIAERENKTIQKKTGWNRDWFQEVEIEGSPGQGNVVLIRLQSEQVNELFTGFGELNVEAETVARGVLREANRHIKSTVPVGPHLADQLIMPMSLAARSGVESSFLTGKLTQHSVTHLDIINRFLNVETEIRNRADGNVELVFKAK